MYPDVHISLSQYILELYDFIIDSIDTEEYPSTEFCVLVFESLKWVDIE